MTARPVRDDPRTALPAGWRDELARLGAGPAILAAAADAAAEPDPLIPGRVARAERCLATLAAPGQILRAGLPPGVPACAGDWALASLADPAAPVVARLLPRRTALVRHAAGRASQPQLLAANMDDVFITVAADRALAPGRVERFLALAWESGAEPVLVLTKADLVPADAGGQLVADAAAIAPGAQVHLVSAVTGQGLGPLRERLAQGRTAALLGISGAGKSSLLNALSGAQVAATMAVRGADGKGRHVTAWRELVELDGGGAVIDTPGLRGLGMWLDEGGLDAAFAEIADLAGACRFTDCRHDSEPGCAVTAAVRAGTLDARRLASYRKLEREAAYVARKTDARAAREASRAFAAVARDGRARARHRSR